MKKVIFILALILSVLCTAQAGHITGYIPASDLKNYTLAFDGNNEPIAAATMPSLTPGWQSIVIVRANAATIMARVFNVPGDEPIEVRDFHYVNDNLYILCGAHGTGTSARAFVATMNGAFTSMQFMEYPEANIFYSIWGDSPVTLDYYVCGKKGDNGVIASVSRSTLNLTRLYQTNKWEYHKIIRKEYTSRFIVSGRDPACTQIGYAAFDASFTSVNAYYWAQNTEPASLCVVSDHTFVTKIVLASSWQNIVTLSPSDFPIGAAAPHSYHFTLGSLGDKYCVQDIFAIEEDNDIRISVAGYCVTSSRHEAWYGEVTGLSNMSTMKNNNYYGSDTDYEHYKVKYHNGEIYTGGFFKDFNAGVLFGTPRKIAENCEYRFDKSNSMIEHQMIPMSVYPIRHLEYPLQPYWTTEYLIFYNDCPPFKGEEPALKSVISAENESEIVTSYDRITLKDIPANTGYQIYNTIGQLISTGVTTPDISTASLSKGVYILRLESGKTFKFVK